MRTQIIVVLLLGAVGAFQGGNNGEAKGQLRALQGEWAVVSQEADGKVLQIPEELLMLQKMVIKNSTFIHSIADTADVGAFTLNVEKDPKQIDFTWTTDDTMETEQTRAIYELKGDLLKICFALPGKARPTAFATKEKTGQCLTIYKRVK